MVRYHLQAHLNMAVDKIEELKKESGRISAVDVQKLVTRVFYYLCVVALQYLAPLMVTLFLALMLKTLGDYSFTDTLGMHIEPLRNLSKSTSTADPTQMTLTLTSLKAVFSPTVFRGLTSYFLWYVCTAWFTTSAFGLIYYSYFLT